jgi:hypothetical protein
MARTNRPIALLGGCGDAVRSYRRYVELGDEIRSGGSSTQPPVPEVVTLCGSMRFLPLMLRVAAEETAKGAIVLAPFAVVAAEDQGSEFKAMLDELHRRKLDLADRVVVVTDETGYYGTSTAREIDYAAGVLGRPVEIRAVAEADVDGDAR